VAKLLEVLFKLRDTGNTLVVIEHNLDVIKTADWIIDLGPEGGGAGGKIVAEGPPEKITECAASFTGHYLKSVLKNAVQPARR
jgi:excinuclease ABC subunit A